VPPPLPVTEHLASSLLTLPTGTAVGPDDVDRVCDLIRLVHGHAGEIVEQLEAAGC
jgi:dTDP-4-amino-4,6-dideoxygalactose transaminase